MVTVRKTFARTSDEQLTTEQEYRLNITRQRLEWLQEQATTHPEQTPSVMRSAAHPVWWVSPDGEERIAVNFRGAKSSAVERVARQISRRYALASAPHAQYLRFMGWRLTPDDGLPGDGQIFCVNCQRVHPREKSCEEVSHVS